MTTKKPSKSKARKLTLRKETLKDLAPRTGKADAVRGGKGRTNSTEGIIKCQ